MSNFKHRLFAGNIAVVFILCVLLLGGDPVQLAAAADGSLGPWQLTSSMTTPRVGLSTVAAGSYIYALGGQGGNSIVNSVERAAINADGSLGPWQFSTSMTTPRYRFAAVTARGYIYAIGGTSRLIGGQERCVERAKINADGSLGPWQSLSSMISTREGFAAVVAGDYVYALGGFTGTGLTSSVERAKINADGSLDPWENMPSMASTRASFAAVAASGYLYALGGVGSGGASSVERAAINADGSLGSWQLISAMNMPREYFPAAVAADGYLYALGSHSGSIVSTNTVERAAINADGSLGPWHYTTPMTTGRASFGAVVVGRYMYAVGGMTHGPGLSSVERAEIHLVPSPSGKIYLPLAY